MTAHAKLSPSASHRWLNCPGSLILSEQFPNQSSRFADEGTFAHDLAAQCLEEGRHPMKHLGVRSGDFVCDEEMAEHIQTYVDVVNGLMDLETTADFVPALMVEERVKILQNLWGTADAIILGHDDLHVVDLKYGAGVLVEVEDNPQLMIYALGALRSLKDPDAIRNVHIHVVQPRHALGGHSVTTMSRQDLLNWRDEVLMPTVERIRAKDSTLCSGEWCRWCPAASSCPEIHRVSMETAQSVFGDTPETPAVVQQAAGPIRAEDLTPDQLGQILAVLPTVEDWIKSMRANAFERLRNGTAVPGYKLVRTAPHRKWTDEGKAFEAAAKLTDDPLQLVKLKSPAQVEKILGRNGKDMVSSLVEKPEGQLTLASEKDRRKAATVLPAFSPIEDDESEKDEDGII